MIFNSTYSEIHIAGWSNITTEPGYKIIHKNNYNYLYIILIFLVIGLILKILKKI